MISSMSSAACTALRNIRLSVGGTDVFGCAIWIHQFCSGMMVMFLSVFRSGSDLVGRSSTPCSSPVFRPATRACGSVTMRNVTVSKQACL